MKRCPTCDRTFEDSFTFCLIDGSVLSAPFDLKATLSVPEPRQTEPPPTEVLPPNEGIKQEIPPTIASPQPEREPEEVVTTITAPAPAFESPEVKDSPVQPARKSSRLPLMMLALGAVVIIGLLFFINPNRSGGTDTNTVNTNTVTANTTNTTNTAPPPSSNRAGNTAATPSPSPTPVTIVSLEGTVWHGMQDNEFPRIYEFKAGGSVIEKSGAPGAKESSMSTHRGSWTLQGNRVTMNFPKTRGISAQHIEATILGDELRGVVTWESNTLMRDDIVARKVR
jgi:hypothetical protein